MKNKISYQEFIGLLEKVCLDMESAQEQLRQLDAASGDGDLGVSVKLGFQAVREELSLLKEEDIGSLLVKSGMTFNRAAASTFGTLMATVFMRAGQAVKGLKEIGMLDISAMMKTAIEGVQERGKALPGERTMLDAMIPAQETWQRCVDNGQTLDEAMAVAAEAAQKGAELTSKMEAKHGRAGWLAEKSAGVPDAGATAMALMLKSISEYLMRL